MAKIKVVRSILIASSKEKVFKHINDFNRWIEWSPWLLMEAETKVKVADDGKSYNWEGKRVGSGNMKLLKEKENKFILAELNFFKPWKSSATTSIELEENGKETIVTWTMNSSLPFFMFWMRKSMESYVGADYERGLDMLKILVETGSIPSKLNFLGISEYEGCNWIGIKTESSLDTIAAQMQADFGMLWGYANEHQSLIAGNAFTIYHKWDIKKNKLKYTAALPVASLPENLPKQFSNGFLPASKAYKLQHTGSYHYLGNAWATGFAMMRNKEFKYSKSIKPFEVYYNRPMDTEPKDLIAVVHFPVK